MRERPNYTRVRAWASNDSCFSSPKVQSTFGESRPRGPGPQFVTMKANFARPMFSCVSQASISSHNAPLGSVRVSKLRER
jgi:hypothetical protein